MTPTETIFVARVVKAGWPAPLPEYAFATDIGRKWRFDWSWPAHLVAVEVEGGIWVQGRHNRASGYVRDLEKYNEASARGWLLLRALPANLASLEFHKLVVRALANAVALAA